MSYLTSFDRRTYLPEYFQCLDPNIVATWTDSYERSSSDSGKSTGAVVTTVDHELLLEIANTASTDGLVRSLDASLSSSIYSGNELQPKALQAIVCIKI